MKYVVTIFLLALVLNSISFAFPGQTGRCAVGHVRGFASVRGDPRLGGIGALPGNWAGDSRYFQIRYNCTRKGVWAKRVDVGVYDVMFPENPAKVAQVTVQNQQGSSASVAMVDRGYFRVVIRGPVIDNNILLRREQSFYITLS